MSAPSWTHQAVGADEGEEVEELAVAVAESHVDGFFANLESQLCDDAAMCSEPPPSSPSSTTSSASTSNDSNEVVKLGEPEPAHAAPQCAKLELSLEALCEGLTLSSIAKMLLAQLRLTPGKQEDVRQRLSSMPVELTLASMCTRSGMDGHVMRAIAQALRQELGVSCEVRDLAMAESDRHKQKWLVRMHKAMSKLARSEEATSGSGAPAVGCVMISG